MEFTVIKPKLLVLYAVFFVLSASPIFILSLIGTSTELADNVSRYCMMAFSGACMLSPIWIFTRGIGYQYFAVNSRGVEYRSRKMQVYIPWDKVTLIALMPDRYGRFTRNSYICFFTEETQHTAVFGYSQFNENVIGVQYRRGIDECIKAYSGKDILFNEYLHK